MAVHTRHPAGALPAPPARESSRHLLLRGYAIFVIFGAMATTFWFNLLGIWGLAALLGTATVLSAVLWWRIRPPFPWRRLPWAALAYVAWALVSAIWSHWSGASLLTWWGLAATTLQALFLSSVLTWRELVRAMASALKWVMALSLAFELWVALVLQHPVLPNFLLWDGDIVKELYWSRGNLFLWDQRIQGIVGNAALLAVLALLAIVVFGLRMASHTVSPRRRWWLGAWIVLAAFLLWRSQSATVWLAVFAVGVVLAAALLMRTVQRPGGRTKYYALFAVIGLAGAAAAWALQGTILAFLGKSPDMTGREGIWQAVTERAVQHPVIGWGFATPWVPWVPEFDHWIVVNDLTVFHAHDMWLDAWFQLGIVGVVILAVAYLAFIWRAWFFGIDRPRFDLRADRPYQSLTLLPTLVATILLVQGLAESRPLMEWGWMLFVMLAAKIKQSPLVGEGPSERSLAIELGDHIDEPTQTESPIPTLPPRPASRS